MHFLVVVMLLVCIGLPLGYAWRVSRLDESSWAAWLIVVADAGVVVALVLLVGRWDMAGHYTRFLVLIVFLAAVLWSLRRHTSRPWKTAEGKSVRRGHWTTLFSLVLFGAALAYVISGTMPPDEPRELAFPLKDGRFMVGQGGGIGLLNHHASHPEQRYAADMSSINEFGYRAAGILPEDLGRYTIFGALVVSPCAGEVVSARDSLPDLVPPESDGENPAGNHVIIDCGGINVELAHLQQGSVEIEAGERIGVGDAIGKVGNSGNTTEPHLHIHAVDPETGVGVPMSFGGRVPIRNRLYAN